MTGLLPVFLDCLEIGFLVGVSAVGVVAGMACVGAVVVGLPFGAVALLKRAVKGGAW